MSRALAVVVHRMIQPVNASETFVETEVSCDTTPIGINGLLKSHFLTDPPCLFHPSSGP